MAEKIAVIGLGYIGLPTAVALAAHGAAVTGVDIDGTIVKRVNRGEVNFVEPGLETELNRVIAAGSFHASTVMPRADVYIIAVPTPLLDDQTADLSYIEIVSRKIAPTLSGGELLILESTVPPGTTEKIAEWLNEEGVDTSSIQLAHCPERVLPGKVMVELFENDRVVGGTTQAAAERAAAVYRLFCRGKIITTDARTAEMTKLVENSFRDVNIAFANELSVICAELGVDVWELIRLANHHPRVNILQPGPGVGGHCIAVDPWFIVSSAPQQSQLIRTAREVNDAKPAWVVNQVSQAISGMPNPRVAVLGLSFKANIDDLRQSPAIEIVELLAQTHPTASIAAVEPHISALPGTLTVFPNVSLAEQEEALKIADVVVFLVDHDQFTSARSARMGNSRIIDICGAMTSGSRIVSEAYELPNLPMSS